MLNFYQIGLTTKSQHFYQVFLTENSIFYFYEIILNLQKGNLGKVELGVMSIAQESLYTFYQVIQF